MSFDELSNKDKIKLFILYILNENKKLFDYQIFEKFMSINKECEIVDQSVFYNYLKELDSDCLISNVSLYASQSFNGCYEYIILEDGLNALNNSKINDIINQNINENNSTNTTTDSSFISNEIRIENNDIITEQIVYL